MATSFDTIVLGGGHNGLVCAALLAKKGRKVVVLEKTGAMGGLASAHEFYPGFTSPGIFHDTSGLRPDVVDALDLKRQGLKLRTEEAPVFAPQENGRGLLLWRDAKRAEEELAPHSAKDAARYKDYRAFLGRIAPVLKKVFDEMPPDVVTMTFPGLWELMKTAVSLRFLGKRDMMDVLRIGPMCVADWLNEWFESDILKSALAGPSIHHTFTGPWSPGTNANLLLAECFAANPVVGGPQALIKALALAARSLGVELRTEAEVKEIIVTNGAVSAVHLTTGEEIATKTVAAACDPKQLFLNLIAPSKISHRMETNVRNIRARGTTAKITFALSKYPEIKGRPSLKAEYIRTGEYFDQMERAFDAVKYREFSAAPIFDIYVPTLEAPELAPKDQHVMSVLVHFAPHNLDGGWTEEKKAALYETSVAMLSRYMPDLKSVILGKEILTPVDLEKRFNLTGGQMHHGEHAADQLLVRPTPECSRYATPIAGLFICGSGGHPGGGITGAPGMLASKAILG